MQLQTEKGIVTKWTVKKPDSGWGVGQLTTEDGRVISLTGVAPQLQSDLAVTVSGTVTVKPKYGTQFNIVSYVEDIPRDSMGILAYLKTSNIRGIGKVLARRMVEVFGDDLIDILNEHPERLVEVDGLGEKKIKEIISGWQDNTIKRDMYIKLQGYGITRQIVDKLYEEYGMDMVDKVQKNPYMLAGELDGIGFKRADEIALRMGFDPNSIFRYESFVLYMLRHIAAFEGSCYAPMETLKKVIEKEKIFGVTTAEINYACTMVGTAIDNLLNNRDIISAVVDGAKIFGLRKYAIAEGLVARVINGFDCQSTDRKIWEQRFDDMRSELEDTIIYSDQQREAIISSLSNSVTVITGGPGVGKTTIVRAILEMLDRVGDEWVSLCAPTGRAAKRLTEVTHRPASTIHRLLKYQPPDSFAYNEDCPLECTTLILEEASMVDISLMSSLMQACPQNMRLVIVGDVDQLPSVGAGNVLKDIIDSGVVNVIKLDRIYRQKEGSSIISVAHDINNGNTQLNIINTSDGDVCFVPVRYRGEEESYDLAVQDRIVGIVKKLLDGGRGFSDIQILTPQKKEEDVIGSYQLNKCIQDKFNPNLSDEELCFTTDRKQFAIDDKVMHIKNNYTLGSVGVFNGDTGIVAGIDNVLGEVIVQYEDEMISYNSDILNELVLAYAITIHKSQGSEYPVVIIPCSKGHHWSLTRKLLYTATTRGKGLVVFVGDADAFRDAIGNVRADNRYTLLKHALIKHKSISDL